jgi:hypothetical protein
MSDYNYTEIGIMWRREEGPKATGVITTACPIILRPGDSLALQEIEYENEPPEKAPDFRITLSSKKKARRDDIPF